MEPDAISSRRLYNIDYDDDDDDEWVNEQDYYQQVLEKGHPSSSSSSPTSPSSKQKQNNQSQKRKSSSFCGNKCNYVVLGIFMIGSLMIFLDQNMMKIIQRKTMSSQQQQSQHSIIYDPSMTQNREDYIESLESKYTTTTLNQYKSFYQQQIKERDEIIINLKKELEELKKSTNNNAVVVETLKKELEGLKSTNNNAVIVVEGSSSKKAGIMINKEEEEDEDIIINESNTISIMSFSNGQTWCDHNALWNAYYQNRPKNIQRIELMYYEASTKPSKFWIYWQTKFTYSNNPNFRIKYRWFNSSEPFKTPDNPALGELRNQAMDASNGYLIVNFDNDDIYHPNYLKYVTHHLSLNPTWMNIGVACHAKSDFNPDGTYHITYCDHDHFNVDGDYRFAGHTYSYLRQVFTKHNIKYPTTYDVSEENSFIKHMQRLELPIGQVDSINYTTAATTEDTTNTTTTNNLGSELLLIKTISPLSKTSQIYYARRELFNRMKFDDTQNLITAMKKYYQDMHELQRPSNIPALALESSTTSTSTTSLSAIQPNMKVRDWKEFHYDRYPNGFGSKTNYPHCEGFAGLMGTRYLPKKNHTKLIKNIPNSKECCKLCSDMDNKTAAKINSYHYGRHGMNHRNVSDSIRNNYCGAFTYNTKTKSCRLGIGTISFTATTAFTFETGIRIDPTCPRCGDYLMATGLHDGTL